MFQSNLELLSEKKKKEASLELLNQRFNEKLVTLTLKHNKPFNKTIEKDENLESFKNEFKKNYNYISNLPTVIIPTPQVCYPPHTPGMLSCL